MSIFKMRLITQEGDEFTEEISKAIGEYKARGLHVEIEYSTAVVSNTVLHSAIVIGREPKHDEN